MSESPSTEEPTTDNTPVEDSDAGPDTTVMGFPADTAPADMTAEQQVAYYKHQARLVDNKLHAFKGVTPKQVSQMRARISELENANLTADEKTLKEAVEQAAAEATSAASKLWSERYQGARLRSIAAQILDGEQLEGWMAGVHPPNFALDDGEIDEDKVMTTLTAMFGRRSSQQPAARQWGQYNTQTPTGQPGSAGRAEAERRFNKQ